MHCKSVMNLLGYFAFGRRLLAPSLRSTHQVDERRQKISTKATVAAGGKFHLYNEELLSEEPRSVFLAIEKPSS